MIGSNLGNSFVGNRYFGGHWDFSFYPDNIVELVLVKYNKIVILHWKRVGGSRQQVNNVPLHTPHPPMAVGGPGRGFLFSEMGYSTKHHVTMVSDLLWKKIIFQLGFPFNFHLQFIILWRKGGRLINYRPSDTMMTIDINLFRSITS